MKWAAYDWRGKRKSTIRSVIENNLKKKRPLGRSRLRWVGCVIKDVGTVKLGVHLRETVENINRWKDIC